MKGKTLELLWEVMTRSGINEDTGLVSTYYAEPPIEVNVPVGNDNTISIRLDPETYQLMKQMAEEVTEVMVHHPMCLTGTQPPGDGMCTHCTELYRKERDGKR